MNPKGNIAAPPRVAAKIFVILTSIRKNNNLPSNIKIGDSSANEIFIDAKSVGSLS